MKKHILLVGLIYFIHCPAMEPEFLFERSARNPQIYTDYLPRELKEELRQFYLDAEYKKFMDQTDVTTARDLYIPSYDVLKGLIDQKKITLFSTITYHDGISTTIFTLLNDRKEFDLIKLFIIKTALKKEDYEVLASGLQHLIKTSIAKQNKYDFHEYLALLQMLIISAPPGIKNLIKNKYIQLHWQHPDKIPSMFV